MKIRGSLKINKGLQLVNPGGLASAEGLLAVSDQEGNVRWGMYSIPLLNANTFYSRKGTLVNNLDKIYYSLVQDADGAHFQDTTVWKELAGTSSPTLSQDIIDALNGSSDPSAGNVFATLRDVNNLQVKGTATASTVLVKSFVIPNILWISSTDGVDSLGESVLAGDGLVSTGSGWKGVGAIRGPRGIQGITGTSGTDGIAGVDGSKWYQGTGIPSGESGAINDFYINTVNGDFFEKTALDTWVLRGNIKGAQGPQGVDGTQGIQGATGLTGAIGPQGTDGVEGPQGIQGPIGLTGEAGSDASNNAQRILTLTDFIGNEYIVTEADNNFVLIIKNETTAVSVKFPASSGLRPNFNVGFYLKGSSDVSFIAEAGATLVNPIGFKGKGYGYTCYVEKVGVTSEFLLLGNTKA